MEINSLTLSDPLPFARSYQLEALEKSILQNTIVHLETGSGKTLIAIMLLRSYAYLLRKPSHSIAVFLVPTVVLVEQQAEAVKTHTDLKVGMYWGDMGVDFWDGARWEEEIQKNEVLVMTPAILLGVLRCGFFKINIIKVLIMDECHHATGGHPYARIMTEFYHPQLKSNCSNLPRIFGMTASFVKSKGGNSEMTLNKDIIKLESVMHSKVYTSANDSVVEEFIPISTPKFKFFKDTGIPSELFKSLANELDLLGQQWQRHVVKESELTSSAAPSICKRIDKDSSALIFCLQELGLLLALKAAEFLSSNETEFFSCGDMDVSGRTAIRKFRLEALQMISTHIGPQHPIGDDIGSLVHGGLLTSKVQCLTDSLLEYRGVNGMRCIIFVDRIVTAIALEALLREVLPKYNGWKTKYIAGNNSKLQNQTRTKQNEIIEEFRMGLVNIIVATSILEEGLDVQSCNLVIRFDPPATVSSFIQSRGRARVQNSVYILMVESGDLATRSRLEGYISGGDIMRKECLRLSSLPCEPLISDMSDDEIYRVERTGAIVNLKSSIGLIYLYCSRLPADGYFKPMPRWEEETGTLLLPKSCPISSVCVQGSKKTLKNVACLKACKLLHKNGALTDNLVPDIVVEKNLMEEFANEPYNEQQPHYVPSELVNFFPRNDNVLYHCYLLELNQEFNYDVAVRDVVLAMRCQIDPEISCKEFKMCFDRGGLMVKFRYVGTINLGPNEVLLCRRFQITLFGILLDHNIAKLEATKNELHLGDNLEIDYLLLPATTIPERPSMIIDWPSVTSIYKSEYVCNNHVANVRIKDGWICSCELENSLVYTPHSGKFYIITGRKELDGNSPLKLSDGWTTTYKKYYKETHEIDLCFEHQQLYNARPMFHVQNCLHWSRQAEERESTKSTVELPPELFYCIMAPISINTIYSFSLVPSIIHRLESLLVAFNLKKMCMQNDIPIVKILEAITTKKCEESFHYKSLKTLGDSFLKYAAGQYLYQIHPTYHEGLLSVKKDKIISNAALRKLGCTSRLSGFIRNSPFDPRKWIIPGNRSGYVSLKEESASDNMTKIYVYGNRKIKPKVISDVVQALIGAFLNTGGEKAALKFLDWVGIKVDFDIIPSERLLSIKPERLVNVRYFESLLNYSFNDNSLLVEALTHGSYMVPKIPICYQRLEFLGDSVLDFLVTEHMYNKYPDLSPGLLTDLRSASVNNDCYARSAIKADLHKHILHASLELHRDIVAATKDVENFSYEPTFGWQSRTYFPKVLGDIIESLAGAIMVDSGFNKETVFRSIMPLLEPLITPDTVQIHPVPELQEYCRKQHFIMEKPLVSKNNGLACATVRVLANGNVYEKTCQANHKKTAKKLACKEVLTSLKNNSSGNKQVHIII